MILSNTLLERVLNAAMDGGADFAEVFCEETRHSVITGGTSGIQNSSLGLESGVGIRLFSGLRCRYAYTNDCREDTLLRLTRELASSCRGGGVRTPLTALTAYAGDDSSLASLKDKLELIRRAAAAGMDYDSEIAQMSVRYLDMDQQVLIANSEGLLASDRRQKTRMQITAYARWGENLQQGFIGPGAMAGLEFYDSFDLEAAARQAAQEAKTAAHAKKCPSGMMTVVVDNGFGGLMFHEACGHSLEASSVSKGHSEFSGRLGQQVASPLVTLIDDGTLEGQWGSLHVDDEGNPTQRNVLIENGILKGYMIDKLESRRMGVPATGSGRRQSYRFPPEARMTNTFIAAGNSRREDIISSTERGLFVGGINGGSVNPVTGEFNFSATGCRLIENGRLTEPVQGPTLIGTGGQVLEQVDMVGDNLSLGQGYCFNNSGALFICAGQPTIRVKNILVGGTE